MRGFVKIDRRLFASEMWKERRKFSRFEAWLDILQRAAYKDTDDLKAGEVRVSVRKTAIAWGWEKDAVHRFLRRLIKNGYISQTEKEGVYNITIDTNRDTKRDTKGADNQKEIKTPATQNETPTETPHLSYNKKDITKKGGVCLSHTPTPREEVRVTDSDWKRFQEWADEKIHWMSGNITREMYTGMRQKVNNSRLLADILIRIYLSGEYETPQQISEQFGKFTA